MARRRKYVSTMEAGVASPEYLARSDEDLNSQTIKDGLNASLINAGGVIRRPGTKHVVDIVGKPRLEVFDLGGAEFRIAVFTAARVQIVSPGGSLVADITSAPWGANDIAEMAVVNGDNRFYILSDSFAPQELKLDGATWSLAGLAYAVGIGGSPSQPYWRYAEKGITITPSALTGSITLTASDNVFDAAMVGTIIRYIDQPIEITAVASATSATGTVLSPLYPSYTITVDNGAPYAAGQEVRGDTSGAVAQCTAASGSSVTVVMLEGFTNFTVGEQLSSPGGTAEITAVTSAAPQETVVWDEQMISAYRGYPRSGAYHRKRLLMAGFPLAANALAGSATGFPNDFDLGTARDTDAFVDALGDDPNAEIRHIVSAEQLIIITDRGCYYLPESETAPLSPTRVAFNRISPDGGSLVRPILAPEGVVFIDTIDRMLLISQTRAIRGSWAVSELSLLSPHLLKSPQELTYVDGLGKRSERYLLIRNDDETLACMSYRRGSERAGITPWKPATGTQWSGFAAWQGRLFIGKSQEEAWMLEEVTFDALMDGERSYAAAVPALSGREVEVRRGDAVIAAGTINPDGKVATPNTFSGVLEPSADLYIGVDLDLQVEVRPPINSRIGYERRRITRVWTDVYETGAYRVNGDLVTGFTAIDSFDAAPPLMTGASEPFFHRGFDSENTVLIEQRRGEGAPFLLRAVTIEVSY